MVECRTILMLKFNRLEDKQGTKVQRQSATLSTYVDHIAKLGPSFRPQFMEIPSYPLPHHPFFTGSSCAPPSYRIYTATETANGSFFQPSFKEALKGTHRAFDGSEVSAPRTTNIERETVPPRVDRRPKEEWPSPLVQRVGAE